VHFYFLCNGPKWKHGPKRKVAYKISTFTGGHVPLSLGVCGRHNYPACAHIFWIHAVRGQKEPDSKKKLKLFFCLWQLIVRRGGADAVQLFFAQISANFPFWARQNCGSKICGPRLAAEVVIEHHYLCILLIYFTRNRHLGTCHVPYHLHLHICCQARISRWSSEACGSFPQHFSLHFFSLTSTATCRMWNLGS